MEENKETLEIDKGIESKETLLSYLIVLGPFIFIAIICFIEMR